MSFISVNFALRLCILSYVSTGLFDHDEDTAKIPISSEEVAKDMVSFKETLQFLKHPPKRISQRMFQLHHLQLKTKLEEFLRQIKKAQKQIYADQMKKGEIEYKMEIFSIMVRLFGVRARLINLIDNLYPGGRPLHVSVTRAFEQVLTSDEPKFKDRDCIIVFRRRVSNYDISIKDFIDAIRSIHSILSEAASPNILAFEPAPPKYSDIEGIKQMYTNFGFINPNSAKVKTAQIILEPLPMLTDETPAF